MAWFLTRTVTQDTHLGGQPLPTGTNLAYSPYLIHRRPDLYADPEIFDPDRWDPDRWDLKCPQPPRNAFTPFATGARKCIGDAFAMTEATLALATITARWTLRHPPARQQVRPDPVLALMRQRHHRRERGMPQIPERGRCPGKVHPAE
ncbi:cytochrome P450 [Kitasatospora sp. NPDC059817]|uniref:cytochrome P450 n=1 Tax=Kitasatospora sp. NPDC059817 TaxID=3346961 RepID=UPI00364F4261